MYITTYNKKKIIYAFLAMAILLLIASVYAGVFRYT